MSDLGTWTINAPPPNWGPLKALATRLGIDPLKASDNCAIQLRLAGNGNEPATCYDIVALVSALLDRLDKAEQKTHKPLKSAW